MGEYIVLTLAVIGLYAVFARVIALLLPKGSVRIAFALSGEESPEELRALLLAARLRTERERGDQNEITVLLSGDPDESTVRFLRSENVLIYSATGEKGGEYGSDG
jgi:hypothetical protein